MTQIERLVVCQWDDAPTKGWQQAAAQVGAQLALGGGGGLARHGTHALLRLGRHGQGAAPPIQLGHAAPYHFQQHTPGSL